MTNKELKDLLEELNPKYQITIQHISNYDAFNISLYSQGNVFHPLGMIRIDGILLNNPKALEIIESKFKLLIEAIENGD